MELNKIDVSIKSVSLVVIHYLSDISNVSDKLSFDIHYMCKDWSEPGWTGNGG